MARAIIPWSQMASGSMKMAERGRPKRNPYQRLQGAVLLAAAAACMAALLLLAVPMVAQRLEAVGRSTVETDHWMVLVAARIVASRSSLLQYLQGKAAVDAALEEARRALEDVDVAQRRASEEQSAQLVMLHDAVGDYRGQIEAVRAAELAGDADRATSLAAQAAESAAALAQWTQQVVEQNRRQEAELRDGSGAWVYRGVTLLGVFCVALMLGALVWVVRMASDLTAQRLGGGSQPHPGREERASHRSSLEAEAKAAERRCGLTERALTVTQATTGILDPDVLMRRAVNEICHRFQAACVGLFVVDDEAGAIVLQVGMCEDGEAIVLQGHSEELGHGRLSQCIADAQPQVSIQAAEALLLRPDPDLRSSRTEALFPLRDQGQVTGVLVLQDRAPEAYDENTISVLQGIADDLGSAIRAARTHIEAQAALRSARDALGRACQDALLSALPGEVSGYRQLPLERTEPVQGSWEEDMAQAVAEGQVIRQDRTLVIPVKIHETPIGAVRLQKPDVLQAWSDREIGLAGVIVEHLGHALERARLRAEIASIHARSKLTHEVSEQLLAAPDWETLMQTAVQEVGHAVQASRVYVQWVPPTVDHLCAGPGPAADDGMDDR